jgi:Protein of unknown function (DUF3179).
MHVLDVLPGDAIPSVDDPTFGGEYIREEDDKVIIVEASPTRIYPVRILSYHEIVNDVLDAGERPDSGTVTGRAQESAAESRPIAITWCPICASAVVFDRRIEGRVLTFGTSGKLADNALVMHDRETESEWKQPLGRAISGPLNGQELSVLPTPVMSWRRFRSKYPDGVVVQPVRGTEDNPREESPRAVYEMAPYDQYADAEGFGLRAMREEGPERSWERTDIDAKTVVLGIVHDGDAVGYPVPQAQAGGGVVTDSVGGLDILVVSA